MCCTEINYEMIFTFCLPIFSLLIQGEGGWSDVRCLPFPLPERAQVSCGDAG